MYIYQHSFVYSYINAAVIFAPYFENLTIRDRITINLIIDYCIKVAKVSNKSTHSIFWSPLTQNMA